MYWSLYILCSILVSYLLARNLKKNFIYVFPLFLIILITPAQIQSFEDNFAPAIFAFLYNVFLEKDYSLRVLRPLVLSTGGTIIFLFLISIIRKRFF